MTINKKSIIPSALKGTFSTFGKRKTACNGFQKKKVAVLFLLALFGFGLAMVGSKAFAFWGKEGEVVKIFAKKIDGNWEGVGNAIGSPEVEEKEALENFSIDNSASSKEGWSEVVLSDFSATENEVEPEKEKKKKEDRDKRSSDEKNHESDKEEIQNEENESASEEEIEEGAQAAAEEESADESSSAEEERETEESSSPQEEESSEQENQKTSLLPRVDIFDFFGSKVAQAEESVQLKKIQQENDLLSATITMSFALSEKDSDPQPSSQENLIIDNNQGVLEKIKKMFIRNVLAQNEESLVVAGIDSGVVLKYSMDGENWQEADFFVEKISNKINGGYFSYELPEIDSWDELEKLQIKLEGQFGNDNETKAFLDSAWIEAKYQEKSIALRSDKKGWQTNEDPRFVFREGINQGIFKKVLGEMTTVFSEDPQIRIFLENKNGEEVELIKDRDFVIDGDDIRLLRKRKLKPGIFRLRIMVEKDGEMQEIEEEFSWGVLAVNFNKSIYLPREEAFVQLGTLDENGRTLCEAALEIKIKKEDGEKIAKFSTEDGSIEKSQECGPQSVTNQPDYFFKYDVPSEQGNYQLEVIADTENGEHTITDQLIVQDDVPIEVERKGPTRIYPKENYKMKLLVTPNEDFKGKITETLPLDYEVMDADGGTVSESDEERTISWEKNWKAGETKEIEYEFDPADVSPYLYFLGPARLEKEKNKKVGFLEKITGKGKEKKIKEKEEIFVEKRQWQIASDAVGSVYIARAPATNLISNISTTEQTLTFDTEVSTSADITRQSGNQAFRIGTTGRYLIIANSRWDYSQQTNNHRQIIKTNIKVGGNELSGVYGMAAGYGRDTASADEDGHVVTAYIDHTYDSGTLSNNDITIHAQKYGDTAIELTDQIANQSGIQIVRLPDDSDYLQVRNTTGLSYSGTMDYTLNDPTWNEFGWTTQDAETDTDVLEWASGNDITLKDAGHYMVIYSVESYSASAREGATFRIKLDDTEVPASRVVSYMRDSQNTDTMWTQWAGFVEASANDVLNIDWASASESANGAVMNEAAMTVVKMPNSASYIRVHHDSNRAGETTGAYPLDAENEDDENIHSTSTNTSRINGTSDNYDWLLFGSWWLKNNTTVDATRTSEHFRWFRNGTEVQYGSGLSYTRGDQSTTGVPAGGRNAALVATSLGSSDYIELNMQLESGVGDQNRDFLANRVGITGMALNTLGVDVSGRIYTDEGSTALNCSTSRTVALSINGDTPETVECSNSPSNGSYSFVNLPIESDDIITIFLDGETENAVTVTEGDGNDMTGIDLYQDHVIVRHDNSGSLTIDEMDNYDQGDDSDIAFTATSGTPDTLTVDDGDELYIWTGDTFTPGGNLTVDDIKIVGTYTATGTEAITVSGSWANSGTFTAASSVVMFDATSGTETINSTGATLDDFNNVLLGRASGSATWNLSSVLDANGYLVIGYGTLGQGSNNITVGGNLTITATGDFTSGSGTVTFDGSGTNTWYNAATIDDLGAVTIDGTTKTINLASSVQATSVTVGADDVLGLGSSGYVLTISGSGIGGSRPFIVNNASGLTEGTNSTVQFTGTSATDIEDETYYHLVLAPSGAGSPTHTLNSGTIGTQNLTIGDGTNVVTVSAETNDPILDVNGALRIETNGTFSASSTGTFTIAGNFINNDTFTANNGTVTFDGSGASRLLYSAATSFYGFNVATAGKALRFDETDQTNITNSLNLQGTDCTTGRIFLDSNVDDNQWNINYTGSTLDIDYADVEDSNAVAALTADNSTEDNGGNTNWTVNAGLCGPSISVSGRIFTDEGSTGLDCSTSRTVALSVNGAVPSTVECSNSPSNGSFSFATIPAVANDILTVFLDGETEKAVTVTETDGTNMTGIDLYQDHVVVRHDNGGALTIDEMDNYDQGDDSDIAFTATSGTPDTLTVDDGDELYIWTGDTFTPGGNLTVDDIKIVGTYTVTGNETIYVSGSWANSGTYTATATSVVYFDATSGTETIDSTGATVDDFNNFYIGPVASTATWNLSSALDVNGYLVIVNGTLVQGNNAIDLEGIFVLAATGAFTAHNTATFEVGNSWYNFGTFTHGSGTVTFDATTTGILINDGGSAFNNLIFNGVGGAWLYTDGSSTAPNQTTVQNGTPTFLNAKTGTLSVTGGTFNQDWYFGTHVVDANQTTTDIDTGDNDITISEAGNNATVWVHSGANWGTAASSQTTGTSASGINPQPNVAGAIRIREFSMTASATCPGAGCTLYRYNEQIDWTGTYGEYDYYDDQGENYLTSCLANTSTCSDDATDDDVIGVGWHRSTIGTLNTPLSSVNEPPTNGSWYVGMLEALSFTIDSMTRDFGVLTPGANPTDVTNTLTATSSATHGYVIYARATDDMTCSSAALCGTATISDWGGTNVSPTTWSGGSFGFGYSTNDFDLQGGTGNRFSGPNFAGFVETGFGDPVADRTGPSSDQSNVITYRIAPDGIQTAGDYQASVVYVIVATY